jgi:starch synthase
MRVLSVASEVFPLVKTGGLADVAGALPGALAEHGVEMRTLLPGYPAVLDKLERADTLHTFFELMGGPAQLLSAKAAGFDLLVLDAPHLYVRPGGLYSDHHGRDFSDNARRFATLAWAGAAIAGGLIENYQPDIVHGHDWQAGLLPAYLHYGGSDATASVFTVHNLAFQGWFPASMHAELGLPPEAMSIDAAEYFGGIGFLKAGLRFADRITTVSPTYAMEIRTPEGGMALDGLLRARGSALSGILNGIDESVWNPASDAHLAARYSSETLERRAENKAALRQRFGLAGDAGGVLFGIISRLTGQKGIDLIVAAFPRLLAEGCDLVVLGTGEEMLEQAFLAAAESSPGRVGVTIGYDETLAHLIQGGADAILVPSRFEPCGLTQLCAQRYGALPVVARVGGLNDSVIDANEVALAAGVATGLQFSPVTHEALEHVIGRAAALWKRPEVWRQLQGNAMALPVGWDAPAARYAQLYREVNANRAS